MDYIYPSMICRESIPMGFTPLHIAFDVTQLPPLPRIRDPVLAAAACYPHYRPSYHPNIMELALMGDTVLKTIIIEKIQDLADCGQTGPVALLSSHLNTNNLFCYLAMAYNMIDTRQHRNVGQKSYADAFEAYFGALWRESNNNGKADVRLAIRGIFSPAVFPIMGQWQDGRRDFGTVVSLRKDGKNHRNAKFGVRQMGISKTQAVGGGGMSRRPTLPRERRERSKSASLRAPISKLQKTRSHDVIDFTLDDDSGEEDMDIESDDDDIVPLSKREWEEVRAAAAASSWRDKTPDIFLDVKPSPFKLESAIASGSKHIEDPRLEQHHRGRYEPPVSRPTTSTSSLSREFSKIPSPPPEISDSDIPNRSYPSPPLSAVYSTPSHAQQSNNSNTMKSRDSDILCQSPHPILQTRSDLHAAIPPPQAFASPAVAGVIPSAAPSTPLAKLGRAFGSVMNTVEAAFRRRAVRDKAGNRIASHLGGQ